MAYYDPDDVVAEMQQAPVTFEIDVRGLGPLNNGSDIDKGAKVNLPLWLAKNLAYQRLEGGTTLATFETPDAVGPRVMNALRADPKSVDLRVCGPYFYKLAERVLELFDDEDMTELLTDVWSLHSCSGAIADRPADLQAAGAGDRR